MRFKLLLLIVVNLLGRPTHGLFTNPQIQSIHSEAVSSRDADIASNI